MYIGLTPCKNHDNGNVGAALVAESGIKLIEEVRGEIDINLHYRREDFTSRLGYLNSADAILIFNFHITHDSRPRNYRIVKNLDKVETPIIPINSMCNFFPGHKSQINEQVIPDEKRDFIDYIENFCPRNEIPSRSDWVSQVLEQNGYNTTLVGDPGWYDPEYIGKPFENPTEIEQLVFTPPHSSIYTEQAKELINRLTSEFNDANRIVSLHTAWEPSNPEPDRSIIKYADKLGWEIRYSSHDPTNLNFYRDSDLHVGYMKHGHLAHLRWRKPSVVLAENSRAQGFTETVGTAGYPAYSPPRFGETLNSYIRSIYRNTSNKLPMFRKFVANPTTEPVSNVMDFIRTQQSNDWFAYKQIMEMFDETYEERMLPYLDAAIPE